MSRPVFLYGTLLDPRVLARQSGDPRLPRRVRAAVLHGYARVEFRGTPYPTLVRRSGACVSGLVVRPPASALAALSAYEGACYALRPVRVLTRRGALRARAWMVPVRLAGCAEWAPAVPRRRA
ncbi:gamma-glutamylcyclotransferase family protein [Roseomonas sp. CCTCC AB2023176]|uniref:gamma-glutamylcyclotransferase family protein n=1 Tax=Roseomonas sp. CCTCC AB2023176 TaxID=3342640 RepID=UPI0035DD65E6